MKRLRVYSIMFSLLTVICIFVTYDYTRVLQEKESQLKSLKMKVDADKDIIAYGYSDVVNILKKEDIIVKKITGKKDKNIIEVDAEIEGDLLKSYNYIKKISTNKNVKCINNIKFEQNKNCTSLTKVNIDFIENK